MRLIRRTRTALLASAALLSLPLASAHAVERNLFTWSGTVDREVIIEVRGREIRTVGNGLDATFAPRLDVSQPLPRIDGVIRARLENGRGDVEILENPSARNNYTARLRVRDLRAGADRYRVAVWFDAINSRGPDPRYGDGRDHDYDHGHDNGGYDRNRRDAGVLRWSGIVDGVTDIRVQGRKVDMISARGMPVRNVRYDVLGAPMPRHDVRLEVANGAGRGTIRVVQQPSVWNGYVAVIRIDDGRAGAGAYNFDLRW